jgi:hypothetical protein
MAPARPGHIVTVGTATFRTRDGAVIDVGVERAFRDHSATGRATLHGFTVEAAEHSTLVSVATGRAWLTLATALVNDPMAAYEAAQHGIDELGTSYRDVKGSRHVIDDTGQDIILAKMAAERGEYAAAAETMLKVLHTRIDIYVRTFVGSVE